MKRLLVLLLTFVALAAACSSNDGQGRPVALSVNDDVEFSRQEIYDQLEVVAGAPSNSYDAAAVAGWLDTLVVGALAVEIFDERGIPVPEELVVQQFDAMTADPTASTLDDDVLLELAVLMVAQEALLDLADVAVPEEPTEEAIVAYYDATTQECVAARHILIATDTRTVEEAEESIADIQARLDEGEVFGDLAAELSEDPSAATNAGLLDCAPQGSFVPEFEEAAWSQPIGEVGDPVVSDFGIHLIVVEERGAPSLEESRAAIEAALVDQAVQALDQERRTIVSEWLIEATLAADVFVDGRFGRWVPIDVGATGEPEVVEPEEALAYAVLPPEGPVVPEPQLPLGGELSPLGDGPIPVEG